VDTAATAAAATVVEPAPPTPSPATAAEGQRVCAWCGEVNPADATQCFKCGAAFPRPEQDALLNRVSAERMRLALDEIGMHERMRAPWWKKLFGGGKSGATT
jgi:ribosomal protein L40E